MDNYTVTPLAQGAPTCKVTTPDETTCLKRGICPECIRNGLVIKLLHLNGCEVCPVCGWSPCG
jgi:hypothetical protein